MSAGYNSGTGGGFTEAPGVEGWTVGVEGEPVPFMESEQLSSPEGYIETSVEDIQQPSYAIPLAWLPKPRSDKSSEG